MTDEEDSRNEVEKRQKHRTDSSPMKLSYEGEPWK